MFIYIHLPFCLSQCIYCDFYVELKATPDRRRAYLEALKQEIAFFLERQDNAPIQTVYLGGGTPALFSAEELAEILACLAQYTDFEPQPEITLEANPEGMASAPEAYRAIGINRLSIGIQSFQPNELKRLSRIHSRETAIRFFTQVRAAGFENISIDLMYGIPEQTQASWADTLDQACALAPEHISMYGLQVEPGTALEKLLTQGRLTIPPDELTVDMYFQGLSQLESSGYSLYEISNLAKPGKASRHNLAYWNNQPFWGFGVSAHGYINQWRYENAPDLATYLAQPIRRHEQHFCTPAEQLENTMIFGLRKQEGVHIPSLEAQYGIDFNRCFGPAIDRFLASGALLVTDNSLRLSRKAIPVSNEILQIFLGLSPKVFQNVNA